MDFVLSNWGLILLALASGGMLAWQAFNGGGASGGIGVQDAVQQINREKAVVVDVCDAAEYAAGHRPGARHVPLAELEASLPGVVKNKALPLILVCASGVRSGRAVALARKLGYERAQSLAGGLRAWREANLPVEKG